MLDLSLAQHERGHELTVITRSAPGDQEKDESLPFQVIRIPSRNNMHFGIKAYRAMKGLAFRPDVVHTHGPSAFYCLIQRKIEAPPLAHTAHAVRKYQYGLFFGLPKMVRDFEKALGSPVANRPRYYRKFSFYVRKELFLERYVFQHADLILVVADYFSKQIKDYFGVPPERIVTSYNGSNFDKKNALSADLSALKTIGIDSNRWIILYVGRVDWVKRVHLLVESMPRILKRFPDACLVVAGTGDQSKDLARLVERLNLCDSVSLVGWVPHEKLSALFKVAKCFCLPSYWEGLSKSLLEAMSAEIPVVASDNLSNREVLQNGRYGWLVDDATPEAWSQIICTVLSNSQEVQGKIVAAADLLDRKYRWHHVASRIEESYRKIIEQ